MAHDVLHDCPVCHKPLHITKLHCPACGTSIEGDFQAERLLALTPEQRSFVLSFLRNRGNIPGKEKPARKEVLEMLAQGEITQEQALDMLKKP